MELLQHSTTAFLLHATEPPEKCRHTQLINLNTAHKVTPTKTATPVSAALIHQLLKLLEESSQTSVVTQLDLNENNAILLEGTLSP